VGSSVNLFFLCTKVHINFSAGTYRHCSSCTGTGGTGTGTGGTGTGTGTGGTGTGGTGGTVHKLNCGYIKVSIFFSGGTYQPCSSCTGTGTGGTTTSTNRKHEALQCVVHVRV